jgi:probable rRNA maturation factor
MNPEPLVSFRRKPAGIDGSVLETFAETLRGRIARRDFHCMITGDAELRALNQRYRAKNSATDVLSFPSSDGGAEYLGDIAISLARARAQAKQYGHSVEDELRILMLHGVLHLTGMDHETDGGRMARAEARWRRTLGLPASLIERAR